MVQLLWLIPALPLAGFLILASAGARLPRRLAAAVGVGSVGMSAAVAVWITVAFLRGLPDHQAYSRMVWSWLAVGGLNVGISFYLDALTLTMMLVITGVGFFIHLYAAEYMAEDEGFGRFFAYMNLFVCAMLILVLADNLLLLYLGWEGVGLCSYLLIGFWYENPANGYAARKAFVVTRVGDTAMAVGLFLLYNQLGTLQIQDLMSRAQVTWTVGSFFPTVAALLLLGGAMGKSAQLPLQTWLPDAMAGPTPVSALIHAATMVTAGVYLIARTHILFTLAPAALTTVAVVGAATLLLAGFSALTQKDIKRVLAYSTISQIGYMFLALGVGAWAAAIFHFMIHAFFKALLFLGAGAVIHAMGGEHDMFKMGGLRREMPLTFWTFLIASASLAALPLVTAGFYSKDLIIWQAFASVNGGIGFWTVALAGAFLTSLYTFRMVFLTFAGPLQKPVAHRPGWAMNIAMVVLAVLSICGGFMEIPNTLAGGMHLFSGFIQHALPATLLAASREAYENLFEWVSGGTALLGLAVIYILILRVQKATEALVRSATGQALHRYWFSGWGFDWLYDRVVVRPYVFLANIDRDDIIDSIFEMLSRLGGFGHRVLSTTQNGKMRTYAAGLAFGAALVIGMVVWL
ncbi:MAG: NADH-quinone oxidoreductase subunit L [Desulfobacterales bacterium]